MSDVKRYSDLDVWKALHLEGSTNGWVRWEEYLRLRASSFVTAVPVEQYERLRKAGDAMAEALNLNDDVFDNQEKREAQANWNAAKEGRPNE